MPPAPLRAFHVFVSSTCLDLRPERAAVEDALQRMREVKFVGMEHFGSRDETTRGASLAEVDRCHVYVGIIGGRYGSGITEEEYRRARAMDLTCFIYVKTEATLRRDDRDDDADASERRVALLEELRKSHDVSEFMSPGDLAARVTADLHRWLVENYFATDLARAGRADLPPQQLERLVSALADIGRLAERLRLHALSSDGDSLAVADAADRELLRTGEVIFRMLGQAAPSIAEHLQTRQFEALIKERTRTFIGREFLFDAIDAQLTDDTFRSGYVVVRGGPGIGKTALLGELVRRRAYVHHFNIGGGNIKSTEDFLGNVCAQIVVRYGLPYTALPPKATSDSGFLVQLLGEATAVTEGNPVIVVVDALDEAHDANLGPRQNRLLLPASLPDRVLFVLTTRPKQEYRLVVDAVRTIDLDERDPRNRVDIVDYIVRFIEEHRAQMAERLSEWSASESQFINTIADRSDGNFMYLVHLLPDIVDGRITRQSIGDLGHMPFGLKEYYRQHWRQMRAVDAVAFDDYYQPVLGLLATVAEPVTINQLAEWASFLRGTPAAVHRLKSVIAEWREFLNEERDQSGDSRYRIYHVSFQEFLRDEIGLTPYHSAIAQAALDRIPGWTSHLAG